MTFALIIVHTVHITLTNKKIDKNQEKKFSNFLAVGGVVILGVKGGQFRGSR